MGCKLVTWIDVMVLFTELELGNWESSLFPLSSKECTFLVYWEKCSETRNSQRWWIFFCERVCMLCLKRLENTLSSLMCRLVLHRLFVKVLVVVRAEHVDSFIVCYHKNHWHEPESQEQQAVCHTCTLCVVYAPMNRKQWNEEKEAKR